MAERRTWLLAVVVVALIAAAGISTWAVAGTAADSSPDVAGVEPDHQFTVLAASVLTRPSAVRGTDGRFHIAYELVLTNAEPFALDVERVDVRDAKTHRVLLSLAGPDLVSRMNPVGDPPADVPPDRPPPLPSATLLAPSGSSVVWLDVPVQRKADLPADLEHLIVSSARPSPGSEPIQIPSLVGRVAVGAQAPLELGPPVRGGLWVAAEGCCDEPTHHRRGLLAIDGDQVVPQRFAIDWIKLDERHRAWVGDPAKLSSYFSYGEPLIAAADGTVVVARDGAADAPPPDDPPPPSLAGLPGNHVILRVAPGIYLSYGHMRPGSVGSASESTSAGAGCWESSATAAHRPPHTSTSRCRSGASSFTDGLPLSSTASSSWARSATRSGTGTWVCGPTGS